MKNWPTVCFLAVLFFASPSANFSASTGSISGNISDNQGQPLPTVHVTLKRLGSPPATYEMLSGSLGEFSFGTLSIGSYAISLQLAGYSFSSPSSLENISLTEAKPSVHIDLKAAKSDPLPTSGSDASQSSPPKFQAAGVRGLIDAGGYSAAAQGAAASGLLRGMADMQRADSGSSVSPEFACESEANLRNSVEADPSNAAAKLKLARFYLANDRPADSIPLLESARKTSPENEQMIATLALAYVRDKRFDSAKTLLAPYAFDKTNAQLLVLSAQAEEGLGQFTKASADYQAASQISPDEQNLFGAGYELILAGQPAAASRAFQQSLAKFPNFLELLIGAGAAEYLAGNAAASVDYFLRATQLRPSDPRAYQFLASASATESFKSEQVIDAFRRFADLDPDNPDALYGYALVLRQYRGAGNSPGEVANRQALLEKAIRRRPDFAAAHLQLGILFSERDDNPSAVTEYQTALRLAPDMNNARYRLALALKRTGQDQRAAEEMQKFQEFRTRSNTPANGSNEDIQQFISVLADSRVEKHAKPQCPPGIKN